jgi:hypothetical protein
MTMLIAVEKQMGKIGFAMTADMIFTTTGGNIKTRK